MKRFRHAVTGFLLVLGLSLLLLFSASSEASAQSCGELGGDYCSQTGSCPAGYDSLGPSNDCSPCCLQQPPSGPSCGELGGDYCSQSGSCPAGYDSLGLSNDCSPCCLQQPPPPGPSCGELGGDYCSQSGSCPAGYSSLGPSNDCNPCCLQQPPPPGPSCGELGGDYCSQSGSCPAGYDSLGSSNDCSPCCLQQPPPPGPSCGELGGDYCSQTGSCPAGYDSLGFSNDCSPCCLQQPPSGPSCGELGGDYCSQTGSCPDGYSSLGSSNDCSPCCQQQGLTVQIDAPPVAAPGSAILFRAIVTTNPGESILGYAWEFGDGGVSSETSPYYVYGEEGVYVVSLGVTTDRDYVTVSRTIAVQSEVESSDSFRLGCSPDCTAMAEFEFDSSLNRLVPTARFAIQRGPLGHYNKYHPVIRATVKDPIGRIAFESGFVDAYDLWELGLSPSIHEVEIDFSDFLQSQAPGPRYGRWWLEVRFYYRPIENLYATPIDQGLRVLTEDASICTGSGCEAFPYETTVIDGESATFILANPLLGREYSWDWEFAWLLEMGHPVTPSLSFNPTKGLKTTAEHPRWVPIPATQCATDAVQRAQALQNSTYYINVKSVPEGFTSRAAELTVIVPWGFLPEHSVYDRDGRPRAAQTHLPETRIVNLDASEAILCDATTCTLSVAGLQIERTPARMEVAPSLLNSSSVFREKVLAHEEDHERFFNNPDRCGFKFYTVDSLRTALDRCVAEGMCSASVEDGQYERARQQVRALARDAELLWRIIELEEGRELPLLLEIEAYNRSNGVPPHFVYQVCINKPTPACPR